MRNKPPYPLASVDNALRLIELLRDQGRVRVSDAAEELGIGRSTAHRLLAMLTYRNFAVQDESRGYLPGPALSATSIVGGTVLQQFRRALLPYMEELCDRTDETVNLMVRVRRETRFLACVESRQVLHVGDRQGTILPAHASSGGKALLATLDEDELRRLYRPDGAPPPDVPTMTEAAFDDLRRELAAIRRRGYALNLEGTEAGVCAVGAAVHAATLDTTGAVSISVPTVRLPRTRIPELADALAQMTERAELGLAS